MAVIEREEKEIEYVDVGKIIYRIIKRGFDIIASMTALIILFPVMLAVSAAIFMTDGGAVLYCQERVGEGQKIFKMYKFRSMYRNADQELENIKSARACPNVFFKDKNDPRITPIGRFLRKYNIDELPQLINILAGEMSIVGPRPLPVYEAEALNGKYIQRYSVPQGLTCYWQVSDRSMLTDHERMMMDVQYSQEAGFVLDMKLIVKTVSVVLKGKGEY